MKRPIKALVAACLAIAALPSSALAIQGGELDTDNRYSNVAILRFVDSSDPDTRWRCTGTLVAPDVIITAAHCTEAPVDTVYYSFDPEGPKGEPDGADPDGGWTLGGTNADGTQSIFTDPDWDGDLQLNSLDDIGVIVLDEPVTGITPATIAPEGYLETIPHGTLFELTGYGVLFEKPATSPKKKTSVSDRLRRYTTAPLVNLTSDTVKLQVSTSDKKGGGGTCFGDSGGPLFVDGYIAGVLSWGTSQFCGGQAGYQRLDTADAFEFYGPLVHPAG